jgi:holo-[acyl-carrier protein] synthase
MPHFSALCGHEMSCVSREKSRHTDYKLWVADIDRPATRAQTDAVIVSTGIDLAEVGRIRQALEKPGTGTRFRARVFTAAEIAYCESKRRGKYESYAGRFAAKEAVMKALGRGWGGQVCWLDIEVRRASSGKPEILLHNKTARRAGALGIRRWALSISHTAEHGMAYVIALEG